VTPGVIRLVAPTIPACGQLPPPARIPWATRFGIPARAFAAQAFHRVVRQCVVFAGAENQPHRRIFAGLHPVFAREVGVKVHLADVGVDEFANFEVFCG